MKKLSPRRVLPRLCALMLACLLLLPLCACGSGEGGGEDTPADTSVSEAETEYDHGVERKDYHAEFNMLSPGSIPTEYIYLEESAGDPMSDAVYERLMRITDYLGVTFTMSDGGGWLTYAPELVRSVQAGDDAYQYCLTNTYQGVPMLITSNALLDLYSLPSVNPDAPYWATQMMEDLEMGGRHLLGYNDSCLSNTFIFVYNKDLKDKYVPEDVYGLVRNRQWTLDTLFEIASRVAVDDGDGKWTTADTYGLTGWGWQGFINFATCCNVNIVNRDADDHYYVSYEDNSEKLVDILNKVNDMYTADYSWLWKSTFSDNDVLELDTGRSMIQFSTTCDAIKLRDSGIRYGILPFPLYDENQEHYRTLLWTGHVSVPSTIRDEAMVSDVVELFAAFSGPVRTAFYENLLGAKVSDAPDDAEMLDIIWDAQFSDIGLVCCNSSTEMDNLVYMIPEMCERKQLNFASWMKTNKKAAQKGLDQVFKEKK